MPIIDGSRVRVINPDCFVSSFANKVRDRVGIVERVFKRQGSNTVLVRVRFLKRGNRGKEFIETMPDSFLELID